MSSIEFDYMIAEKAADLILGHALAPEPARSAIA
jgi:hypothetical protein